MGEVPYFKVRAGRFAPPPHFFAQFSLTKHTRRVIPKSGIA